MNHISQLDSEGYMLVCVERDGFYECATCSSAHLVEDKIAQLEARIDRLAADAFNVNSTDSLNDTAPLRRLP
jgi:hypothetical protein